LRIDKRAYFRRALSRGAVTGLAALAVIGATVAMGLAGGVPYADYADAGRTLLLWYAPYATVVLVALGFFYLSRAPEWRALATTIVLGPLTLARPFVIVGGALHAIAAAPPWPIISAIATAGIVMPCLGRLQNAWYRA
jgi:hypothetical protein